MHNGEDSGHLLRSQGDRALSHYPRSRVLSQYSSFRGKMILKWLFLCDTGEDLTRFLRSRVDRPFGHSSGLICSGIAGIGA